MTRRLTAALCFAALACVLTVRAQEPAKADANKPKDKAAEQDKFNPDKIAVGHTGMRQEFLEFKQNLLRLAQNLELSNDPAHKDKAAVLRKAIATAAERGTDVKFDQLVEILRDPKVMSDLAKLSKAKQVNEELRKDLQTLIRILLTDDRAAQLAKERKELQKLIEQLKDIIRIQQRVRAQTEIARRDPKDIADDQERVTEKTKDLIGQGKGGKGGEGANKGQAKGAGKEGKAGKGGRGEGKKDTPEAKGGKKPQDGKASDKEGKPGDGMGEPKDGKGGEGKQGSGKEGKGGEGKQGSGKEGKGGKGKEGSGKEGKEDNAGKGKPKEGDAGKESKIKSAEPKDAKGAEGKQGESKGGDKAGQGKQGESKSGKSGGKGKPGDSKGKSDGKGQSKGSGKEGKPGGQSGSSGKSGQSGQPGGQQGSPKGDQGQKGGQQGNQNQNQNQAPARKKIADATKNQDNAGGELKKPDTEKASNEQDEAIKKLKDAQKQLEELLRQIREEEIERLLAALKNRCQEMLRLQKQVYDNTVDIDRRILAAKDKQPERALVQRSNVQADTEDEIIKMANVAIRLIEEEGTAVAFAEVFKQVRDDMERVSKRLRVTDTGEFTQQIEKDIIATLEEMIAALTKAIKEQKAKKGQPKPSGPQKPQDQSLINLLAELKMIRSMQVRVNKRTQDYHKFYPELEQAPMPEAVADVKDREKLEMVQQELQGLAERQDSIERITKDIATGKNKTRD